MPEPVRYKNKGTHAGNGMFRYCTEMSDAGKCRCLAVRFVHIPVSDNMTAGVPFYAKMVKFIYDNFFM